MKASERLAVLFSMLAWLVPRGTASVEEIAKAHEISQAEVISLLELAACCGVPPYTPDTLLELIVEDGMVQANLGKELGKPRRISVSEGLSLVTSIKALIAMQPQGQTEAAMPELESALAKLEAALGTHESIEVQIASPAHFSTIKAAIDAASQLEIEYYAVGMPTASKRTVRPLDLFSQDGNWYFDAWCFSARDMRIFRLDRLVAVSSTSREADEEEALLIQEAMEKAESLPSDFAERFSREPGASIVTMVVPSRARWVVESLPLAEHEELDADRVRVTLPVVNLAWFKRMLLSIGPGIEIESPPELISMAATASMEILELYRS